MPIQKVSVTFNILMRAATPEEAQERVSGRDLSNIAYQIEEGPDWIASDINVDAVTVPSDQVHAELVAIDNDGTFFNRENDATTEQ